MAQNSKSQTIISQCG